MKIQFLKPAYNLSDETTGIQNSLAERVDNHEREEQSIREAERKLTETTDAEWNFSHAKAATKIRERKLESLREEISIREAIAKYLDRLAQVDSPAAANSFQAAVEQAKREATDYLKAGGWSDDPADNSVLPIDHHTLVRNRSVIKAILNSTANLQLDLRDSRIANAASLDRAKEQFSAARAKLLSVSQ